MRNEYGREGGKVGDEMEEDRRENEEIGGFGVHGVIEHRQREKDSSTRCTIAKDGALLERWRECVGERDKGKQRKRRRDRERKRKKKV